MNSNMGKKSFLINYINMALIYAVIAMISGVFYREFTKFSGFTGKTNLSVLHTHYFLLGMFFFLILTLFEKNFSFSSRPRAVKGLILYHIGLNITGLGFLMRGLTQVWGTVLTKGMDASISGISGIGHILLAAGIITLLLCIKNQAASA